MLEGKHFCDKNFLLFNNLLLNSGRYIRVGKIIGTVKKWSLVALDRWLFYSV